MEIAKLILEYVEALAWPVVVVFSVCFFKDAINKVFHRVSKAKLPGGVAIDFSEEIKEAREVSREVKQQQSRKKAAITESRPDRPSIPHTDANARLISLGLRPSPSGLDMTYYQRLAEQDPNIALAGLRMEVEILARNLARGFDVSVSERDSAGILIRRLLEGDAVTQEQFELTQVVLRLCNAAVHGIQISRVEAEEVIDLASILASQYLDWLSWGFDVDWTPPESNG